MASSIKKIVLCMFGFMSATSYGMCYRVFDSDGYILYKGNTPPVNIEGSITEAIKRKYPDGHLVISDPEDSKCQDVQFNYARLFSNPVSGGGASKSKAEERLTEIRKIGANCSDPSYLLENVEGECNPKNLNNILAEKRKLQMEIAGDDKEKQAKLSTEFKESNSRLREHNKSIADREAMRAGVRDGVQEGVRDYLRSAF